MHIISRLLACRCPRFKFTDQDTFGTGWLVIFINYLVKLHTDTIIGNLGFSSGRVKVVPVEALLCVPCTGIRFYI